MTTESLARRCIVPTAVLPAGVVALLGLTPIMAQNPELQAQIQESVARNKQALATYTWQEQQTISLKGEQKSQKLYQVQFGPEGQPQKVDLTPQQPKPQASEGLRKHRLKERAVEKKTDEMKDYGQQISALVHSYVPPNPQKLQAAFQQGSGSQTPAGPGEVQLKFTNYNKPGDSMTLVFNTAQKAIQSVQVASYLSDPSDAVTFSAQFTKLPDGTNYMASATVNGVKKQLTIQMQNFNHRKLGT